MRFILAVKTGGERMTKSLRWDHGTTRWRGQSVYFRCRTLTRQRGHTWKVVLLGVPVSPKCPCMSDDICVRVDVTRKKVWCYFWDSVAHFRATQGFLLFVNLLCFSCCIFSSLNPAKQKVRGWGGDAAELCPVCLMEQIWSSSSQESSSMPSHKALFCQQSERRQGGTQKKKRKMLFSERKWFDKYDEKPLI